MPCIMGPKLNAMCTNLEEKKNLFSNQLDPNVCFLSGGARCPHPGGGGKLTPLLPPTTCNEKEINLKDVNSWEKIYLNASVQLTQELLS